jgi:hypothetical protein
MSRMGETHAHRSFGLCRARTDPVGSATEVGLRARSLIAAVTVGAAIASAALALPSHPVAKTPPVAKAATAGLRAPSHPRTISPDLRDTPAARAQTSQEVSLEAVPVQRAGVVASPYQTLRLMNYYPARHSWGRMWTEWDPGVIRSDLARISAMGANAVRLVLPSDVFGYPTPSPTMLARLSSAVTLASEQGLRVQLTLFDSFSAYNDLAGSRHWASQILRPYRNDPRIAFIEIQNEMDARNAAAMAWARAMIPPVQSFTGRPVAVSAREYGAVGLRGFADLIAALKPVRPDIFSYHFYGDPAAAVTVLGWAKKLAAPTPIFVGEAGVSTGDTQTGPVDASKEEAQRHFFVFVEYATRLLGLAPAAPWTLSDFAPGTLSPGSPGSEYRLGLVRLDGSTKPAYVWLSSFFHWVAAHSSAGLNQTQAAA